MPSQKLRCLAVAALTAGVSWTVVSPATAAPCDDREPALLTHTSVASHCGAHAELRGTEGIHAGGRMVTTEGNRLAMATGELARHLGLTGLATAKSVMGVADLGGVAATWAMPSPAAASPGAFSASSTGMRDLSTVAGIPALPALPALPAVPAAVSALPVLPAVPSTPRDGKPSSGQFSVHNRIAGSVIQSPLDLQKPVREAGADLVGVLLPKAVESVEGTSMLPGGAPIANGFTGLAHSLGLH
ncbi:hypothetical protein ITP53_34645 [Nonomuraea sp. K274]|uniref:Secreted protein n=1 Tax=Nonomuraea cypriaca TaxID=1187855 RepID=A0A931F438_9ACTN|nr:hypothetical protein [Nonomuraea cypriaca]MBF8190761.1 hypothetical protein [Nonomuraea cypriaca]